LTLKHQILRPRSARRGDPQHIIVNREWSRLHCHYRTNGFYPSPEQSLGVLLVMRTIAIAQLPQNVIDRFK